MNEMCFMDYLDAVDELLEATGDVPTSQDELESVSVAQESGLTPEQCVYSLVEERETKAVADE